MYTAVLAVPAASRLNPAADGWNADAEGSEKTATKVAAEIENFMAAAKCCYTAR